MTTSHTLPVPPEIIHRACEQVDRKVSRPPFVRRGVEVKCELVAAAMEELNAEASRTLAIRHHAGKDGRVMIDGLDRHLSLRGFTNPAVAEVIAGVLTEAGITEKASVTDKRSHRFIQAVRLSPAWAWTVATDRAGAIPPSIVMGRGNGEAPAWTNLCPVCRAGRLDPAAGRHLFGVHETEYLACTSCGARFVPDAGKFRLVAIARKRDPLWDRLLNRRLTGDEWEAIAQGGDVPDARGPSTRKTIHTGRKTGSGRDTGLSEGRLAVEIGGSTLYFTALPLTFSKGKSEELFIERRIPLREILQLPDFRHLIQLTEARYQSYLDHPVGPFLIELKTRRDPFSKLFLNPFGDRPFCSFRAGDTKISQQCGVYVVVHEGTIRAAGASLRSFGETINDVLGTVRPQDCYLDGDPDRCRINNLLCGLRKRGGLFVHPVSKDKEIIRISAKLAARSLHTLP